MKSIGKEQNTMVKLTTENTKNAIERCRRLKPKVTFIADRLFKVQSANNSNAYVVRFEVKGSDKFGECQCKASQKGLVCYHIVGAATANIYRQSLKRMEA
ncbi:MAG TPA: hypothetical protein VF571_07780 [Pyrinomonadaceae bacterium]|jgi:hypothetical protein